MDNKERSVKPYTVTRVKEGATKLYAVTGFDRYLFTHKDLSKMQQVAETLNEIHGRKMLNT